MIPLCREDCPGISGTPSADAGGSQAPVADEKPIDPRLLPLLRIKQRLK